MREDYTSVSVQAVIDCKCNTESAPTELRNSEAEYRGSRPLRRFRFRACPFGGLALRPGLPVPRAPEVGRSEVTNETTSLNLASRTANSGTGTPGPGYSGTPATRAPRPRAAARPDRPAARPNPKPAAPPGPRTRLRASDPDRRRPRRDGRDVLHARVKPSTSLSDK